jgi:hypothetical protein
LGLLEHSVTHSLGLPVPVNVAPVDCESPLVPILKWQAYDQVLVIHQSMPFALLVM